MILFAGGHGTRLWPISRRNSPKQFEALKEDRSTLQMAIDRIANFGYENIYVSTNERFRDLVAGQIPELPNDHIFTEPARRDLAAAVLLTLLRLKERGVSGTTAILWSDHFMEYPERFVTALKDAEKLIEKDSNRFVFLGESPQFANHNLGWIEVAEETEPGVHRFVSWKYRPALPDCEQMFTSGDWLWNPGYFVFDLDFVLSLYQQHQPELYALIADMIHDEEKIAREYPNAPAMSFDNAIVEKTSPDQAVVLPVDLGWSDPGTLYALKASMVDNEEENYVKGNVITHETKDSFVYNEEDSKLVTTIGLEGLVVVNTKDALLVCHKDDVPKTKELLKKLEQEGKDSYL